MKYIKLFENKWHGYLNGDLVILAYNQPEHDWIYNIYGKITNAQNSGGLIVDFEVDPRITDEELDNRSIERTFDVHLDFILSKILIMLMQINTMYDNKI